MMSHLYNWSTEHGLTTFDVEIHEEIPFTLDEIKEVIMQDHEEEGGEGYDLDNMSEEEIRDLYIELTGDYSFTAEESTKIGELRIMKLKCSPYSYSSILSQADNDGNLFDVASFFFAPSCDDTTGDEVLLAAQSGLELPQAGENRDQQIRGYVGAYMKDDEESWKQNTIAHRMFDNGEGIDNLWYIDSIYIEPKFRGKNYGIIATALFLHKMVSNDLHTVVCSHPSPLRDLFHGQYRHRPEEGRAFALNYLCKLFRDKPYYDPDANILWQYYYQTPKHLWKDDRFFQ